MADLYAALGVAKDATSAQIKAAYRKVVKGCHPDTHPDDEAARERFRLVQRAYDVLMDEAKRTHYDETGRDDFASDQEVYDAALRIVVELLLNLSARLDPRMPFTNLVGEAKAAIRTMLVQLGTGEKEHRKALAQFEGHMRRLDTGGLPLIREAFQHRLDEIHRSMNALSQDKLTRTKALEILETCSYEAVSDATKAGGNPKVTFRVGGMR